MTVENVREVFVALVFNYTIEDRIREDMKTLAYFHTSTPSGASKISSFGTLELKQKHPIYNEGFKKLDYDSNPIESASNKTLSRLVYEYENRNGKFSV